MPSVVPRSSAEASRLEADPRWRVAASSAKKPARARDPAANQRLDAPWRDSVDTLRRIRAGTRGCPGSGSAVRAEPGRMRRGWGYEAVAADAWSSARSVGLSWIAHAVAVGIVEEA